MRHRYIKIGITTLVLGLAFGGLLWATMREGTEYYKHVDEVVANEQAWQGKRLQLHGFVVANSILVRPSTLDYKFKVENNGSVIDASYTGIVPDTFKDTPGQVSEVVLQGRLQPDGSFHADGIMAKCPSKYTPSDKVS
jgi:cytochrome c-type biogenesis protein CcmE